MNKLKHFPLIIITVLICWLAFLFHKSQSIDTELHGETVNSIQQLKHMDALLNQDVLEVRFQSQLNMDPIADHSERLLQLLTVINVKFDTSGMSSARQLVDMTRLFNEKIHLIEQFKSHNGRLRNSLRYLPEATDRLEDHVDHELSHDLYKLTEMILFQDISSDLLNMKKSLIQLEKIVLLMDSLKASGETKLAEEISNIVNHAQLVITEHATVSMLMQQLMELPTSDAVARLFEEYDREYGQEIEGAETYRIFLFVFMIVLFIYVVFLFRRQNLMSSTLAETVGDLEFQKYAMDQHTIVSICDGNGDIIYANKRFRDISQFSEEELLGKNHNILNSGFHPDSFYKAMWATISSGHVWHGDVFNHAKNGEGYWADTTIVPFLDDDGTPFKYIAIRTDITKMKNTKEALKREHEMLERVLASIPSILIGLNEDEEINLWNHAAESTFSIKRTQAVGKKLNELDIKWDWDDVDRGLVESRNTGLARLERFKFNHADGSDGFLGVTMSAIYAKRQYAGMLLLASDITEKIQMASQMQLSQKMEAIGELAAGVAHEVNTPLQYVGDNIRFLRDSFHDIHKLYAEYQKLKQLCLEQGLACEAVEQLKTTEEEADIDYLLEEIPVAIEQSLDGVGKAGGIVSAMKEFSHPGSKMKSLLDVNRAIENTLTVCRNEWKYIAEIETEFDENLPLVECLPEINQVFLNMIVNASHAIEDKLGEGSPERGLITISTSHTDAYIQIEISDSGKGIPENLQAKVFDPFFTTKDVGRGTGQGLSISHNIIVEQHGGTLTLFSEVGKGTRFTIRIPVLSEVAGEEV